MIEWIKFKGSTQEERIRELLGNERFLVKYLESGVIDCSINKEKAFHTSSGLSMDLEWCTHWTPLNLPQEEKWERERDFHNFESNQILSSVLNCEFDNLYSIVNQLKDELRKR